MKLEKGQAKALRSVGVIFLLFLAVFVSGIVPGEIKSANAYSVPNTTGAVWDDTLTTVVGIKVASPGDLIAASIQLEDSSSSISSVQVYEITDNQSNSWHLGAAFQSSGSPTCNISICSDNEIWYTTASRSGHDSFTIQITQTSASNFYSVEAVDVASPPGTIAVGGADGAGSSDDYSVTPISVVGGFPLASVNSNCNSYYGYSFSAGSGYVALVPPAQEFNGGSGNMIYGNPSSFPSSPSDFPAACTESSGYSEVALVFGVPSTEVVPCTAFELQCWLYPLFVFGVYMILVTGMAFYAKVPSRDLTGHLLEAFSLAAMVCVLMGILNIMVPLLVTVVQIVRAFRE